MPEEYACFYPRPDAKFEAVLDPSFHSIIKEARERRGIGLRELARKVKCSHPYLILIEAGERKPSPKLLAKLQEELGLDPFFLISKEELSNSWPIHPDVPELEQSPQNLSYLIGLLHSAFREAGLHPLLGVPSVDERLKGFLASFGLGREQNYEILIRKGK